MSVSILQGDVREVLATLPADQFDCVVTSPPYWGLRDYGVAGQIGLEPTLGEHIAVMIEVFRGVRRVMKPDGLLWLNYGDCYATSPNGRSAAATKADGADDNTFRDKPMSTIEPIDKSRVGRSNNLGNIASDGIRRNALGGVLKAKDLCMIPNRLAIALQEDGWWVRSEIIWGKPNPMPDSSGRYRPSSAHEKIFLLARSASHRYLSEAVRIGRKTSADAKAPDGWNTGAGAHGSFHPTGRERGAKADKQRGHSRRHQGFNERLDALSKKEQCENGRLLRNYEPADLAVWPIAPRPFGDAHFATFPPELAERCIRATCRSGEFVLDPFGGAGTTGLVADRMGCNATLIEINPDYVEIARRRIDTDVPLFTQVEDAP